MSFWKQITFGVCSLFLATSPARIHAQLWSGIVSPSRAVTWQGAAGFPGGTLPDAAWAPCVTTACVTLTTAGSSASAAQIAVQLIRGSYVRAE